MVNINRYNSDKQKLFGVFYNFWDSKGVLRPKRLRPAGLFCYLRGICDVSITKSVITKRKGPHNWWWKRCRKKESKNLCKGPGVQPVRTQLQRQGGHGCPWASSLPAVPQFPPHKVTVVIVLSSSYYCYEGYMNKYQKVCRIGSALRLSALSGSVVIILTMNNQFMSRGMRSGLQLRLYRCCWPSSQWNDWKQKTRSHWPPQTKHHGAKKEIRVF